ncbi:YceD family protein [Nitratireductor sp. GCM10026969]|uniref:YceD family protein n=1 Tax=Nitratireductor sp. GCM10026969 TaxID=3252645 RepID=UPI0036172EB1
MTVSAATSPVSYPLRVNRLPEKGTTVTIEADSAQRAALARLHDLLSVERFRAELTVRPWKAGGVRVLGRVEADIMHSCVVTLEPIAGRIDEDIAATFVPEGSRLARVEHEGGELVLDPEGEDPPEPFIGDSLDIGALAEEFFVLGIDPYPRKEGVKLDPPEEEAPAKADAGPLARELKKLRDRY